MSKTKLTDSAFTRKPMVVATGIALALMMAQTQMQAHAQTAAAPEKIEKIEVTGSRLPAINIEGASPVTVVDAQTIKTDGLRSVENLLNNLPQVMAGLGGNISNGATGTATVDLRNLGPSRTLVLVNGRRLPAGSPAIYAADLNQIPAPLIKRIEILTGGASAIYGSDAIAGVVNFILNDKFEGVQFEVNQSFYNHQQHNNNLKDLVAARALGNADQFKVPGDKGSDGNIFDANILMGGNFANGKGNATLFLNYKKEDQLLQSERDFSACSLGRGTTDIPNTVNGVPFGPGFRCSGSNTSFPGRFNTMTPAGNRTVADSSGGTRAYVPNDQYNFGPINAFQRPSERYGANATANYDISESAKVYTEFSFHDDHTVAQIAPSGVFGSTIIPVFLENPLLSADWRRDLGLTEATPNGSVVINRRNIEGGGRQDDLRHTSFRTVLGVKGELGKVWSYDAFMQTGKVIYQEMYKNDFSIVRTARALDVVRNAAGNVVCRSVVDGTDSACVPYNIWSLGGVTPAALAYLQTPGFQKGSTSQTVQGGSVSADLGNYGWTLPFAKSGVGVAFGVERRVEKLELDTDTEFSTGDLAGIGGEVKGLSGKYTVKEVFGEIRAPLIEGRPFADLLSVNASYRKSDYSTGPKTNSFGFGLEWAPNKMIRTRASYQEAVRAANVIELFAPRIRGLFNGSDPCGAARAATAEQCANTGLPAALYGSSDLDNPAGQYNQISAGNANLAPEESKSTTAGLVLTPLPGLSATIDYFKIKVDKTISSVPPGLVLQQCLTTGAPGVCSQITRDSLGTLFQLSTASIVATNLNLGRLQTSGFDIGVNYKHKLGGYGSLGWDFNGTLVKEYVNEPVLGQGSYDCVGLHGATCGTPQPKWRHKLRATWQTPWNLDFAATWRFFGKVSADTTSSNSLLSGDTAGADLSLAQRNYFDLAGTWAISKQLTFRAGINNLFDKDPPLSGQVGAGFGNGNTYPQIYDALGRRIFLNLTASF
jgi:iron complex outermembrane recepter protein